MIAFLRRNSLLSIKKKIIILYVLNVTDIIFTLVLLQTGFFREVNVFMIKAVENAWLGFGIKVIVPALLLSHLYKMIRDSDDGALRISNISINIALGIYAVVNLSHILWTAILPFLTYFY